MTVALIPVLTRYQNLLWTSRNLGFCSEYLGNGEYMLG
jgi:hypothetical protein